MSERGKEKKRQRGNSGEKKGKRAATPKKKQNHKKGEFDYGCACYESALKAFQSLCEDEHSGASIMFTKAILNRLIDGKPLTPIEDTEDMWSILQRDGDVKEYQCKRMFSLFKTVDPDGSVSYQDITRFRGIDINNPQVRYHSGLIDKVLGELFPIKMPYMPFVEGYRVYTEDFLTDPKNGDFDTVGISHVVTPQGILVSSIDISKKQQTSQMDLLKLISTNMLKERT